MALADLRKTTLEIVNEVQRRLGIPITSTLTASKHATMLLGLLNQVIDEIADGGDWMELFAETTVLASSSVGTYSVNPSNGNIVKNLYEVSFHTDVSPMEVREIQEIRRLQRTAGHGKPRQLAVVGVDNATGNPRFRTYPVPGSAQNNQEFKVAYFRKPPILSTNDASDEPPFPAQLLIQGLYSKALLEENGGEPTDQFRMALAEFERMKQEALNRYTADTGTDLYIVPMTGRW